jgi:hypothetical protein
MERSPSTPPTPPPPYSATHLGPFLTLPNRVSLALIAYPVISLAFVAFRFYLAALRAHDLIDDAKSHLIASCFAAQRAATVAVSLPRWMALRTNEQIQTAAVSSLRASRDGLNLRSVCIVCSCCTGTCEHPLSALQLDRCREYHRVRD